MIAEIVAAIATEIAFALELRAITLAAMTKPIVDVSEMLLFGGRFFRQESLANHAPTFFAAIIRRRKERGKR